jgi:glutamate racemase
MNRPIGLFDSGFGGLTVMKEVVRHLPNENLIYLGDTANLPYGNKSPQTIIELAQQNATFLLSKQIKLLIIACHTACSRALETLQKSLPIPIIGVIQPGVELLLRTTRTQRVAILGTTSTIESGVFQSLIQKTHPHVQIYPIACPLFVPLIEEGHHNTQAATLIAHSYLEPLKKAKVDTVLLACTHYPLMRAVLQQVLGPDVQLVEPAELCAIQAREFLQSSQLLNTQNEKPHYEFYASDDPEKFRRLGKHFLGDEIQFTAKII